MNRTKRTWRLLVPALAALVLLLVATGAQADYEQVPERFGSSGEAQELVKGDVEAMAVNYTGAGGVQPGTFYVATTHRNGVVRAVLRFSPGTEGEEPQFQEAWGWGVGDGVSAEYQRCGPALATEAANHTFHSCWGYDSSSNPGEESGHFKALVAAAVDPSNGYVYVHNETPARKHHVIELFTASGTPVGEGFGEVGEPLEQIPAAPAKLHLGATAMAVDSAGTVYLNDLGLDVNGNYEDRVMSFKPENGTDFEHYVYSGEENDLIVSFQSTKLAWAGGDRLVIAKKDQLHEYEIAGGPAQPVCSQPVSGLLSALTANPLSGEVFYFNEVKRSVFRLSACNDATGKFTQLQQLKPQPATELVYALAVDPATSWSVLRPAGILYVPSQTEQTKPPFGYEYWGDIFATAPVLKPDVQSESVTHTGTTSTTLQARIDPRGYNTSYSFQYLPASTYEAQLEAAKEEGKSGAEAEDAAFAGAVVAPTLPGQLESGAVRTASASIGGLTPDTPYSFRVLASSPCNGAGEPLCETKGGAAAFATYPTAPLGLPDGRAYELVSPAQKNGGEVFPADATVGSCAPKNCKPPGNIASQTNPMQSAPSGDGVAYMGYAFSPTEGAAALNSYISHRTAAGWQTTAETPFGQRAKSSGTYAYSQDLSQGIRTVSQISLQSTSDPTALAPLVPPPLYRQEEPLSVKYGGHSPDFSAQLFSANNAFALKPGTAFAPEPPDPGSTGKNLYEWRAGELSLINVLPDETIATGAEFVSGSPDAHGVSADGGRVFWHVGATVYVREGQVTREITHPGAFVLASEDGGEVLLSDGCLYSLATEECTDLSEGGGGFEGVAGASGDLSRIYFVDTAQLPASGQNERQEEAVAGKPNLYLDEGGTSRFITTLAAVDGVGETGSTNLKVWGAAPGGEQRTAEASPSGRYLAFASVERLTGHANVGPCARATNSNHEQEVVPGPCPEVFLYDSATGRLSCPSCNPSGEAPLGPSTLRRIGGAKEFFPQPRYLTDAGRLFFDSGDRLSPRDANGNVEDVYEYEPQGVGSCARPGGCVLLISPGSGSVDSNFLAADASGANVFFTSREQLVQKDTDELLDLYVAREGGGFPSDSETQRGECQGEACQPTISAPNDPTPASSSFNGAGNVKEAAKPKKKKKHHNKKHAKKQKHGKHRHGKHGRTANNNRGGAK